MTAESLKPFISLPENFPSEKRSSHRLITIGLSASFVILSVALLGFTIWNSIRVCELQSEVDSLRNIIGSMQKRLGLDYLDDLSEFDDGEDNFLVDDPKPYAQSDDDDDDEDDEDDDEDSIYDEELKGIGGTPPMSDFGILDGSGQYGDDDDEDIDDSAYDSYIDDLVKQDAKKERKPRSIASLPNGIPIYQDSYAVKRNRTGGPEDERIEQHLLANKGATPTLRYDWSEKSTKAPSTTENAAAGGGRGRYQSAPSNMLRSVNGGRQRLLRRHRNQRLMRPLLKSGSPQAMTAYPAPHLSAVHFHLNSTISGRHLLHADHNKLPHDGDVYIGSPHPWARQLGMDRAFSLNHGVLTVKDAGLYFIYAQIYYDNRYDRNGFVIYHNVHPFLQCALFVPTNTNKSHTCYTSGVIYLESNDELHLRDIHQDRVVMLTNAKSFFGIIKLGEI